VPSYVRPAVALGATVGVFGVSFGILAVTSGLSVPQTVTMSLLVFTGASQFAAVGVVASGGTIGAAIASALLLAARNGAYGLALAPTLRHRLAVRLVASQLVIDESTAVATAQSGDRDRVGAFWVTGLSVFVFWNAGTVIGAVAGQDITDPAALGLDAAFPAGFLALLGPHVRRREGRLAALLGGAVALVLLPLTPVGTPILAAAGAAGVVALRPARKAGA
jgi:4-azaleucine resistance transporter AzlC